MQHAIIDKINIAIASTKIKIRITTLIKKHTKKSHQAFLIAILSVNLNKKPKNSTILEKKLKTFLHGTDVTPVFNITTPVIKEITKDEIKNFQKGISKKL